MGPHKDDTIRPDGRQDNRRKEEGGDGAKKQNQHSLCPAGEPRTRQETPRRAETKGQKTAIMNKTMSLQQYQILGT